MSEAQALRDELIARRRDFHQHPELAFEEVRTAGIVAKELNGLGLEVQTGVGKTGVVGILEGNQDGPTVLVRCDMDALPVREANTTEYNSLTEGKMHACGHDGHTAIGLGVAKMLAARRAEIAGRVKFLFQPAEEIAMGAQAMVNDGALINPKPDVSLGLHVWNDLPIGEVSITDGPSMAGSDTLHILIKGFGGHGASPYQTRDPIMCGAMIVNALQTIVSRNINALDSAVVSVTQFHAGDANNVIPSTAKLSGTFRTYTDETHDFVEKRIREIATGIATAMGCEVEIAIKRDTLPVANDLNTNARLRDAFGKLNTELRWHNDVRTMGAEDMAVFLRAVPGTFMFVGSANSARDMDYPHHHPRFDFDEDALPIGAGLLAAAVADYVLHD
jgi:amidohydrolase